MTPDKQKSTLTKPLKHLHSGLTELTAVCPGIMWATMIIDAIGIGLMILAGVDALVIKSNMSVFRMVVFGYGIINAIFYTVSVLTNVCEPPEWECEYTTEKRMEHYGKVLAPMIVLFPILLPMWTGLIVSMLVAFLGSLVYSAYKRLESIILR